MPARNRLTRTVLAVVSAAVLVVSVSGWAASEHYLSGLNKVNVFNGLTGSSVWNGEPANILVVGSDDRSGLSRKQANRLHTGYGDFGRHTDTMMLIHLGRDLESVTVVSLPRDSLVTIPAHQGPDGQEIPEGPGKINAAFASGGPALTVATVQKATGLEVDHYVEVNFAGFLKMVEAVGGVEVCLEQPMTDELSGLNLPAGRQTIQGTQALAYVRARHIDNDFGRSQRQQRFLAAMLQKAFSAGTLLNPVALNGFIDAAVSSVTTDEGLNRDTIAALASRAADLDLGEVTFTSVPVTDGDHLANGESTVLWDDDAARALFEALAEDAEIPEAPKAVPVEVAPDEISVAVAGSGDAATRAQADLQEAGFTMADGGSQASPDRTTVTYDPIWANSLKTMQAVLPDAEFVPKNGHGEVFTVAPASDYAGLQRVRAQSATVEQGPRSAKDNICSAPPAS